MDVEAIVTVEIRLNAGHGRAGAQQGLQDAAPLFLFVGSGAVVLPAQLLCTVLFLRGGVFIAAYVGGRAFHNIQSVHRVCPFHTMFPQGLYHILCRCVIGCFPLPHLFLRLIFSITLPLASSSTSMGYIFANGMAYTFQFPFSFLPQVRLCAAYTTLPDNKEYVPPPAAPNISRGISSLTNRNVHYSKFYRLITFGSSVNE